MIGLLLLSKQTWVTDIDGYKSVSSGYFIFGPSISIALMYAAMQS